MERITTQMTAQMTVSDLTLALDRLNKSQSQLASGKRITQPSDDPYGTSLAMQLNGQLAGLDAYDRNVSDGSSWTQATDSSLMDINNMTQRVRELVVGAANGTNNQSNLNADAAEIDQLTDAIKQTANTQYNGQYIFSGSATTTPPYTTVPTATPPGYDDSYGGVPGAINRQIGPGATNQVQINTDISQLLGGTQPPPPGGDTGLLSTLRAISADMRSGTTASLGGDLTKLDENLGTVPGLLANATLEGLEANVGAVEDRLQLAASRIQDVQLSTTQNLSNDQDVDMAQTAINYSTEQAAYTAALQASAKIVQSSLLNYLQ